MTERKKNGFVIEMMIIFMLITFGFCILITTIIIGLNKERKYARINIEMQTDLNQIGEYYLRYIQLSGGEFPSDQTEFSQFNVSYTTGGRFTKKTVIPFEWMGEDFNVTEKDAEGNTVSVAHNTIKDFFLKVKNKYTYETYYTIQRGGYSGFFETQSIWRMLVVRSKSDGKVKMIVELTETRTEDTKKTRANYEIQTWSIGDDLDGKLDDINESTTYKEDDLSILQILWRLVGQGVGRIETALNSLYTRGILIHVDSSYSLEEELMGAWNDTGDAFGQILEKILGFFGW